ncbi:glucose transporter type 1-like [Mercenaria mercenaria]|uniref:glucose transporter type 1-like n=1 Tax=Mercenaria mercenaria TaxID=6596 RepID=UPI00234EEE1D|nr:glucose transporter type 1-like [Mercenaria mercenaria]
MGWKRTSDIAQEVISKQTNVQLFFFTRALELLRGTTDVDFDIEEMRAEKRTNIEEESVNFAGLFRTRSLRKPLLISVVMHLSQQLSGINAIFYYSFNLFKQAGLENTSAAHATSGVGGTMIVMTIITIPLMDRLGRRTLHLIGLGGMFVFSILITLSLALSYLAEWLKVLTIVMALLYVVSFATGPGSIPWLIVSELFAQGSRPAAMSISVLVNWIANFAVGFSFPYMQRGLKEYSFLPFTVLLGIFIIFTIKYVPETKNRTITDITQIWDEDRRKKEQTTGYREEESLNI